MVSKYLNISQMATQPKEENRAKETTSTYDTQMTSWCCVTEQKQTPKHMKEELGGLLKIWD